MSHRTVHTTPRATSMSASLALLMIFGCAPARVAVPAADIPSADTAAADLPAPLTRPAPAPGGAVRPIPSGVPLTRPERTNWEETSTYDDVLRFLDSLELRAGPGRFVRGSMGRTNEARELAYVIASRPLVRTPAEAHALGRPVVYVQGNIHGGEVEGKEALQMLLRDLVLAPAPNVLDSIVLIALPLYNADGNERWGPQERQRGEQHGPAQVGLRPNAQGLDLNRDYVKAEAPETRAALAFLTAWEPHVFVDLHTTNGSYHGYALTYAPSLHPSAPLGDYTRELLDTLQQRVRARYAFPTFEYGNFSYVYGAASPLDTLKSGWWSYDHRPRFGTNYYGLRNRIGVLSEAYSHDPFGRRIAATYVFVRELLSLVAERGAELRARVAAADDAAARAMDARTVALRSVLDSASAPMREVIAEDIVATGDSARTEPGVRPGWRRTGRFRAQRMPVYTTFRASVSLDVPAAFALPAGDTAAARVLRLHGLHVEPLAEEWRGVAYRFRIDSVIAAPRPFQGHHERRFVGEWMEEGVRIPAGTLIVSGRQRFSSLAAVLLDPLSDDGLATWGHWSGLAEGDHFPVLRLTGDPLRAR